MNCKNCGYPLFSNDKFCKNCGQEVVRESDIAPVVENNVASAPVINNGPIVDPTKPTLENVEPINNVSIPQVEEKPPINNGPIAPVISEGNVMSLPDIDAKKIEPVVNYDKIDGPKGVSNVMSMMGPAKEPELPPEPPKVEQVPEFKYPDEIEEPKQEPVLANVNQGLPSLPKDKKENKSSVIIPTKPKPITPVEQPIQQPVNNNYNNGYNNNNNYNNYNNNYNNSPYGNTNYNNNYNNQYNMPNNMQQPIEEESKGNVVGRIIGIILVLAILGVGGYFGYKYFVKGGNVKTKDVSYSGYNFKVPESMKTQVRDSELAVYDDNVILSFTFVNGSYSDISTSLIVENFSALGNTATYLGEKEKNGNKYHLFQVKVSEKNAYVGYTASGSMKVVCFSVEPNKGTERPNDDYLNKAIDIAMSPTYNGASNIETEVKVEPQVTEASQALIGEEASAGDTSEEVYEDVYVNITLNEINE